MNKTKLAKTPWDSPVALLQDSILYQIDSLVSQKNMLYFREKEERIFKRETPFFFSKKESNHLLDKRFMKIGNGRYGGIRGVWRISTLLVKARRVLLLKIPGE